jgi:hypothetical protein
MATTSVNKVNTFAAEKCSSQDPQFAAIRSRSLPAFFFAVGSGGVGLCASSFRNLFGCRFVRRACGEDGRAGSERSLSSLGPAWRRSDLRCATGDERADCFVSCLVRSRLSSVVVDIGPLRLLA